MERRMAALYGHDPRELETGARMLALRGVHPTVDAAREALLKVSEASLPEKPTARRPLRVWVRSLYLLLVFGGFIGARTDEGDKVRPLAPAGRARLPDRARDLGHDLGPSRQLHDRDGLGL